MRRMEVLTLREEVEREEGHPDPSGFVALDFETATSDAASACALGVVRVEHGRVTDRRAWLVRPPGNRHDSRNTAINGLRASDTASAPSFGDLWPEVLDWLGDVNLILAHNAAFDIRVLRASLSSDLPFPRAEYGCTLCLARRVMKGVPNHRLDTLCRHFGLPLNHHEAESDALACAMLAMRLAEASGDASPREAFARHRMALRPVSDR